MTRRYDKIEIESTKIFSPDLLKGKVALITGGSNKGICSGIAKAFLAHGCTCVALMARKAEKLQKVADELNKTSERGTCLAIPGDVTLPDQVESVVSKVIDQFGKIDILVNGAGGNFLA